MHSSANGASCYTIHKENIIIWRYIQDTRFLHCENMVRIRTPQQVWEAKFFSPSKYCKNMFQVVSVHLPIVQKTIRLHLQ